MSDQRSVRPSANEPVCAAPTMRSSLRAAATKVSRRRSRSSAVKTCSTSARELTWSSLREARHHFTVELGMRLPRLRGDHPAVSHRLLLRDVLAPARLGVHSAVLVRRHARPFCEASARQYLDAVAD